MHYVYKITNLINSKLYIGKTNDINIRWYSHCNEAKLRKKQYPLYHAMNKYGITNFTLEIIEVLENELLCFEQEKYWIELYKTNIMKYGSEFGYNLTEGGEGPSGHIHTPEQKKAKSDCKLGVKNSFYGKNHSDKSKKLISNGHIGKPISSEVRDKISKKLQGVSKTEEMKQKISIALTGQEKSESHCKHISESKKGKPNPNKQGNNHHNSKITEQQVIDMRQYWNSSNEKSKDKLSYLYQKYGLSKSGIQQIVYRTKWKHIP